jgi:uncharacterized membrane protein YfcA
MEWWLAYPAIGAVVGFLAGLLGIGGGAVMVPMLLWVFAANGFAEEKMMHLALATAMATIVFTSVSSVRAHARRGGVDWRAVAGMLPGIVAGSVAGALIASGQKSRPLAMFFGVFMLYAASNMLIEVKPKPTRTLPGRAGLFAAGGVIGAFSSLLAAGGAFLTVPFLAWCNVPLARAIGTAAAVGFPLAVAATIGYVIGGLGAEGLPPWTLGYVYLPALALVASTSILTAPLGARVTHRLPVRQLRTVFALMLYAIAARMLWVAWAW